MYTLKDRHIACRTTSLILILGLAGCASLDPSNELRVAAKASQRVAGDVDPAAAWALPVEGESPAWNGTDPLTYEAAVAVALQSNPDLRIALSKIVEHRALYVQQGLPPNPTIGFGLGLAVDGLSGAPMMVQGLQMLSWLWKNPHRVLAAEAELRAAVYDAVDLCVVLMARTRTQLATVLAQQELVAYDAQFVGITKKTLDFTTSLFDQGEAARTDVDRAVYDHARALAELEHSTRALEEARIELLTTMGRPIAATDWVARGALPPEWSIPLDRNELLRLSDSGRLDVASAHQAVIAARAELGLADTTRFPDVTFTLRYQKNFGHREALLPGGAVTIPILDNGDPAVAAATARLEQRMLELIAAREQAQREVLIALNQLIDARRETEIIRTSMVPAAVSAQQRSEAAYEAGEVSFNTILDAQRDRIDAERRLVSMQLATMKAMCSLRRAVGGSFDPALDRVPEFAIEAEPSHSAAGAKEPTS